MIAITTAHNEARLQGTVSFLDSGVGNARVRLYAGARPATPSDTPGSPMLVEVGLTKPCGSISAGLLSLTQAQAGLIAASGIATWARVVNGDGNTAFDCDAGQGPGDWEIELVQATLYAGGEVTLVNATLG